MKPGFGRNWSSYTISACVYLLERHDLLRVIDLPDIFQVLSHWAHENRLCSAYSGLVLRVDHSRSICTALLKLVAATQ